MTLADSYADVQTRIRAALVERSREVELVAVSKTQPIEKIEALYRLGHRDFGENYAQELVEKAAEASTRGLSEIRWHFIGHLQTNKVKLILPFVASIHSVDSLRLAEKVSAQMQAQRPGERLKILVQVNLDGEQTKGGIEPQEARSVCEAIAKLPGVDLQGLMCIPRGGEAIGDPAPFRALRELEAACQPFTKGALSMGMSQDFELALREGATSVRVGTRLFGARPPEA